MVTAFMGDAANIMSFYGDADGNDTVGYAAELWIFKPQKSGQQVKVTMEYEVIYDILIAVRNDCHKNWQRIHQG